MPKTKQDRPKKRPGRHPTACKECRRLKLGCDRQVPCGKCVARGCASICPDGELARGKGNRLILATTEELHERNEALCIRIRELEHALRASHSKESNSSHPLLSQELLGLKNSGQAGRIDEHNDKSGGAQVADESNEPNPPSSPAFAPPSSEKVSPASSTANTRDSLDYERENILSRHTSGTLSMKQHGDSLHFGNVGRSEHLSRLHLRGQKTRRIPTKLSVKILELVYPDSLSWDRELWWKIYNLLPEKPQAERLCKSYLYHGQYMYFAITQNELYDEIFQPIYRHQTKTIDDFISSRCRLALLFLIFAIGSLFDHEHDKDYMVNSRDYYRLARAVYVSQSRDDTTLVSVQVLLHMSNYLEMSDWASPNSEMIWSYLGQALRLSASMGLHLNSQRWSLESSVAERRHQMFWSLFLHDTWTSFFLGRSPSIPLSDIDCPIPGPYGHYNEFKDLREVPYQTWMFHFTVLFNTVIRTGMLPKTCYSEISELDLRIQDFGIPRSLQLDDRPSTSTDALSDVNRWLVLAAKEWCLLTLHRPYCVEALKDRTASLDDHAYRHSVVAVSRSTSALIHALRLTWGRAPRLLGEMSLPWSQLLTTSIITCLMMAYARTEDQQRSSIDHLNHIFTLFQDAAASSPIAKKYWSQAIRIRDISEDFKVPSQNERLLADLREELDRLCGITNVTHNLDEPPANTNNPTTFSSSSSSSSSHRRSLGENRDDTHDKLHNYQYGDFSSSNRQASHPQPQSSQHQHKYQQPTQVSTSSPSSFRPSHLERPHSWASPSESRSSNTTASYHRTTSLTSPSSATSFSTKATVGDHNYPSDKMVAILGFGQQATSPFQGYYPHKSSFPFLRPNSTAPMTTATTTTTASTFAAMSLVANAELVQWQSLTEQLGFSF